MKKISVLGSCVTRDIFSIMEKDKHLGDYRARTSLHTLFSPGLKQDDLPDLSLIESNWQRKMVENDLLRVPMNLEESEYLIIDFIDDRFQKVIYKQKLVSFSNELIQILRQENYDVAFRQGSIEDLNHWRQSCIGFSKFAKENDLKLILHKSRFARKHLDGDKLIDNTNQSFITIMNDLLELYEGVFLGIIPETLTLEVRDELIVSDPEHKWGLAPFHYIPEYYEEAWSQINDMLLG
jgi:hypothetical protein